MYVRLLISLIAFSIVLCFDNQKKFEWFIYLAPPMFSGETDEEAYEFQIDY